MAAVLLLSSSSAVRAAMTVGPWIPLFKGVDYAAGTNTAGTVFTNLGVVYTDSNLQIVRCVRVDLTDPDVQLLTTPRASSYVAESRETLSLSVIAEGVENEAQRDFLHRSGSSLYQGYLKSWPLPIDKFDALLNGEKSSDQESVCS